MVREALLNTAGNTMDPNNDYGWGIIDIMSAIHYYDSSGDINYDGELNVMDLIEIVSIILMGESMDISDGDFEIIDGNNDDIINILDVIYFVNIILN